ncbi:energy transducer TonB [Aquamicrobium zhengzhouense]|uniref:Energy transducer TonB n=1 Tax=Aquamicrobium zhengzhouense TaxID=2781738 RepID=A0ABS0SFZ1_9HYPH|nr:energy transducer TonB [Aquamicrobium zhengzhouense]MBI1622227.1 energy transducer TonB [Aquamicrobium zhengzhouense]
MSEYSDVAWSRSLSRTSPAHIALWAVAAVAMVTVHAGAAWLVMRERPVVAADDAAPAIMVEFASMAMSPSAETEQVAPDEIDSVEAEKVEAVDTAEAIDEVEPVEAEPVEETAEVVEPEIVEAEPVETALANMPVDPLLAEQVEPVEETEVAAVASEVVEPEEIEEVLPEVVPVPQARPERPVQQAKVEKPKREKPREEPRRPRRQEASQQKTRAQVATAQQAPRAAAPQASAGSGSSMSPARWQSRLMSHLERRKRYPSSAKRARKQGVVQVRFTIDGSGNVGSVALTRSSGVSELDNEVLSLVRRASPVPAPPPGVSRTIVVPIKFSLR